MAKQNKVSRFPNKLQRILQDSGIVLFSIIAVYMVVCLVMYLTKTHVSVYEVKHGSISKDYTYTGLALRTEQLVMADRSGYITYYAREGQKVGAKTTVCSVDESGQLAQLMEQADEDNTLLTTEDIMGFKEMVHAYQTSYDDLNYNELYSFKQNLEGQMLETVHLKLLDTAAQSMEASALMNIYKAASDGILSYHVDGLENLTLETITTDILDAGQHSAEDLKQQSLINTQDTMYKLITEDDWSVIVSMDSRLADTLVEEGYIEVTFLKDNKTAWAQVNSWQSGEDTFVQFSFTNSMVRYASERYLKIRFNMDDHEGLKVPLSAVADKDFYVVPVQYITKGGAGDDDGVYIEKHETDGSVSQQFQVLNAYRKTDTLAYVSMDEYHSGDVLLMPESGERYTIAKTERLQGVYNINKGYAVFSPVTILCSNKEYCILDSAESSLSQYDRIVLDAKTAESDGTIE